MRRLLLLVIAVCCITVTAHAQQAEHRVALVIGNTGYQHVARLANPGNDAKLIADTLQQPASRWSAAGRRRPRQGSDFDRLVQEFGRAIQGADVALFYYAGHGMQVDGSNWLVPMDANPTRPQDLEFQMINAELVLKQMDGAGTRLNLVILDACRNNPFAMLGTRARAGRAGADAGAGGHDDLVRDAAGQRRGGRQPARTGPTRRRWLRRCASLGWIFSTCSTRSGWR